MKLIKYILTLFLFIGGINIYAQEYHVTKNGDDNNSGSFSSPWESIQHAMDNVSTGSTVFIHEGIYNESLYVNVSGTTNNYITFIAYNEDKVIIDAEGQTSTAVIEIYDVHHIVLENLTIRNHQRNDAVGILVEGASDHIRIDDCEIYNINFSADPNATISSQTNAHAIAVYGDDANHAITNLEILDNEIHDCRLGFSEALVVNGNIDGFVINGNEVYDVTNIGIDIIGHEGTCDDPAQDQARNGVISKNVTYNCLSPYATSAGIYVDGGKNLIIEQNRVFNNQWGIEIGCENSGKSTDNIIVRNNLIYGNATSGLAIGGYDYPSGSGKVINVSFINNTLYSNDNEDDYSGEIYLFYSENLEIINNIIYGTSSTNYLLASEDLPLSIGLKFEHNNWITSQGSGKEEFYFNGQNYQGLSEFENAVNGNSNISKEPNFVSLSGDYDFSLKPDSEMINKGLTTNNVGEEDFAGNDRIIGTNIDIGAYEYDAIMSNDKVNRSNILVYPNPAQVFITIHSESNEVLIILNAKGEIMLLRPTKAHLSTINIAHLEAGLYYIQRGNFTQSFIKL